MWSTHPEKSGLLLESEIATTVSEYETKIPLDLSRGWGIKDVTSVMNGLRTNAFTKEKVLLRHGRDSYNLLFKI